MAPSSSPAHTKPVRNLLHPALVHVPLALLPIAVLLDLASWVFQRPALHLLPAAFICLLVGVGVGVVAAIVGVLDYLDIRNDHPAKKTATLHMVLNLIALGLFAVSAGLRYGELDLPSTPPGPLFVALIAFALLGYSGYLGGILVYDDGIAVGRHRRHTDLPETTLTFRDAAAEVAVAADSALPEGRTLRVEVNGTVVALARREGRVYAFQEFCPHRYGPLSEGAFVGCEVICPWHRSRFDVRTGKVAAGPAKVDLRTFRTTVRDGQIWLEVPQEKAGGLKADS